MRVAPQFVTWSRDMPDSIYFLLEVFHFPCCQIWKPNFKEYYLNSVYNRKFKLILDALFAEDTKN